MTAITKERIEQTIAFHGHSCAGLHIGIRAAELALQRFGNQDADLVAVVETDNCSVDAIQFLTGCTFGKGNLIHKDYGKAAYTFYNRKDGDGFRAVLNPDCREKAGMEIEFRSLVKRVFDGTATDVERQRYEELKNRIHNNLMNMDISRMFTITTPESPVPRCATILSSLRCDLCGEMTMESRTRRFDGQTLCIPCFMKIEQKT